jgi:vitamin B12/bleomycin/antimicrobial peptide transport system ATP-binding/permease protein
LIESQQHQSRASFMHQILRLAHSYWHCGHKWKVRGSVAILLLLTLLQVALAIWTSYWNRALFDALEQRSMHEFLYQIGTFVVIFLLTMAVTGVHLQVKRYLQLGWRQCLTEQLLEGWMTRGHHYRLLFTEGEHDNPDGRIADDIRIVTETAITLGHTLVYSLLVLGSFIDILLALSGPPIAIPGTSLLVPGYMVLLAFAYAGGGTVLGLLLGRPLIRSTNRLQTAEASFRFGLARSRENSESIALMHGEGVERAHSSQRFVDVAQGWTRQTLAYTWIVAFSSGYGALLPVFPILVAAPQYIAGVMSLGILMQAAQAFQKLTSALSWPVDNLADIAKCRASADRVLSLYDDAMLLDDRSVQTRGHRIDITYGVKQELVLENLNVANPDGQLLLENFSDTIRHGDRVIIVGDPAVAISLFKVIAGLWPWGQGTVRLPPGQNIVFMPQRPFIPHGSLREVLCYPASERAFELRAMHHALECAGAAWLAPRLDDTDTWDRILPLRVQQRLAFARLFLQRPAWIFIEEATDALDKKGEDCMMEMLVRELPNSALITISFHPGLERFHQRKIVLNRAAEDKCLVDG